MKALATALRRIADCIYVIRCTDHNTQLAVSFSGAMAALKESGRDGSVYTLAGRWIAGRRLGA